MNGQGMTKFMPRKTLPSNTRDFNNRNDNTIETVIIYGAGASTACGAPLQKELFRAMVDLNQPFSKRKRQV